MPTDDRPVLILVDGNHLLNRNFHIPRFKDLGVNVNGHFVHTGAAFGYVNSIRKIYNDHVSFDAQVINVWDAGGTNFRKEIDPTYKANRDGMSNELFEQLDITKSLLSALGVSQCWEIGQEADDLIGIMASKAEKDGWYVMIISADKDFYQLVTENVNVLRPGMGEIPELLVTPAVVEERFGVTPKMFVELKALMGDGSDNIGGLKGIGPKTGADLIKANGTIAEIIAKDKHFTFKKDGSLKPVSDKVQELINNNKMKLASDRLLVEIKRDADFKMNIYHSKFELEKFKELCEIFQFHDTLKYLDSFRSLFNRE